jgi:alkanesulfonate monooxygenase SsuD/methylene tetrahydromethanopterin reductase-like flavin-dependent oxidoreductase (luciferase family)
MVRVIAEAGLDHVVMGDHVSFQGGHGVDGLVEAAMLLGCHPSIAVHLGVFLLPLRHPVLVARQLASIAEAAPGRLHFGIGVGGEDRHEVEVVGVDPATRGRRTDESLAVLRALLTGDRVTHHGEFFDFDDARILPAPHPPIPMVVGGRSEAALRRTALLADGWLGIWVSAARFAEAVDKIEARAAEAGRSGVVWDHGVLIWCGFADSTDEARRYLGPSLEGTYGTSFSKFERYTPAGRAEDVAAALLPYVAAGATHFDLVAVGPDRDETIAGVAEVRRLLNAP